MRARLGTGHPCPRAPQRGREAQLRRRHRSTAAGGGEQGRPRTATALAGAARSRGMEAVVAGRAAARGSGDPTWPGLVRGGVGASARCRPRSSAAKRGLGRAGARRWTRAEAGGRGRLQGGVGRIHDAASATVDGSGRESRWSRAGAGWCASEGKGRPRASP